MLENVKNKMQYLLDQFTPIWWTMGQIALGLFRKQVQRAKAMYTVQ